MPQIRILPTHLVNKIAAGEVIERPASVVKELIENALDAEATRIDVAIEDGGRKLIAVTDDGAGMSPEDLALAFAPHATSKIAAEDDLERIETMGFRGEALASIASISHAHVRTRRRDQAAAGQSEGGYEAEASEDGIAPVRPCPAATGTTVTIRDLFFNTPARRKFLRAANTELGHITEQIARAALPYSHVAFRLSHNGREIQNLPPASSTLQRAADLFGQELVEGLLPVRPRAGGIRVNGLVSAPSAARASGKWQYIFLNGRYIRDRLLSHALREAYRGLMDPNRWPVAMLFIRIDPGQVDVNVHPTKIEVRFRDSQAVHGEVLAALRDTLNRANLTPDASLEETPEAPAKPQADGLETQGEAGPQTEERRQSLRQALADFFKSAPRPQPRLSFPEAPRTWKKDQTQGLVSEPRRPLHQAPPEPQAPRTGIPEPVPARGFAPSLADSARPEPPAAEPHPMAPLPRRALQVHNAYIVTSAEDGLLIVDQHALHERLVYNDLKRRLADGTLTGQKLLIPEPLDVAPAEADALHRHAELLTRLGIEVVPFGPASFALQQFPAMLAQRGVPPGEFLREILDRLAEDETTDSERLLEDLLEALACKAAVKAGEPLTSEEIDALLARREEAEKGSACPHGRPTTLRLTLKELQKQFKRT